MDERRSFRFAASLAFPLAALFGAASLGNLVLPSAYALETPSWAAQGLGQDWVDLFVAVPSLVVLAWLSLGGSRRSRLLLAGVYAYTAYSLVLYAFALHFNALFLVYTAGLGVAFYAVVGIAAAFLREDVAAWFPSRAGTRPAAVLSIVIGTAFYALWLTEIVPALAAGQAPPSLREVGLITNPVQILDIGIVLPAFIVGAVALLRRRPLGHWLVPAMLAFSVLMDVAIIGMMVSMAARGGPAAGPRLLVIAAMAILGMAALWGLLRRVAPSTPAPSAAQVP